MSILTRSLAGLALALLAGCMPGPPAPSPGPSAAAPAGYAQHKANRAAYMYQGGP